MSIARFIDSFVSNGEQCENCGHDIVNVFVVELADGAGRIHVGSECVKAMCDTHEIARAEKVQKRIDRATREWRNKKPSPFTPTPRFGEGRAEYINRRVKEMENARRLLKAINDGTYAKWKQSQVDSRELFARYIERISGVSHDDQREFRRNPRTHGNMYDLDCAIGGEINRRREERFARKYGANFLDICRRTTDIMAL